MKKEQKKEEYEATIKILGRFYNSTGNSVREAIENLKPEGKCVGMSILIISKGDIKKEKILSSMQIIRLFSPSRLMREVALKNVSLLFDNI